MEQVISNFMSVTINDLLDILIIAFLFYKFLMLVKETRAEQLIKGLIVILIVWKLSEWAELRMVNFLIKNMMTLGLVALIIVFQPELRRALEYIGRSKFLRKSISDIMEEEMDQMLSEIVEAVVSLASTKTGAIIAIERETGLNEVVHTGVKIDAFITAEIIKNIFFHNAPLHDGAIVIKKNRITAASCLLPLTHSTTLSNDLGTRHRAALGLVERSDAMVIVVSEETGVISLAMDGKLSRFIDKNSLTSILRSKFKVAKKESPFSWLTGRVKREEHI
nr:diadenylate cyclase CdaA [Fusibacter sp. A1]